MTAQASEIQAWCITDWARMTHLLCTDGPTCDAPSRAEVKRNTILVFRARPASIAKLSSLRISLPP